MSVTAKLSSIQAALKSPKNQRNNFGNYNYRSCEDILEAVKPLANEHGCAVVISDKPVLIGDRHYIEATATLRCGGDPDHSVSVTAYAMEAETKKGMDSAQITGATSSYARKYALNGLFAIDDTRDADSTNNHEAKLTVKIDQKQKKEFVSQVRDALASGDDMALKELWHEWDTDEKAVLWKEFNSQERATMKELMK